MKKIKFKNHYLIKAQRLLNEIDGLQDGTLMAHADGSFTEVEREREGFYLHGERQ